MAGVEPNRMRQCASKMGASRRGTGMRTGMLMLLALFAGAPGISALAQQKADALKLWVGKPMCAMISVLPLMTLPALIIFWP